LPTRQRVRSWRVGKIAQPRAIKNRGAGQFCEGIATSARSRGRGNPDFAKLDGLSMGKVWIPASAGMSGWRGFVFFRSFLHTLYDPAPVARYIKAARQG
jgi:hypothetical protein